MKEQLYDDAAAYGRFSSKVGAVFMTFIAIIFIALGVFLVVRKDLQTKTTNGKILECVKTTTGSKIDYHCKVEYTVQSKNYKISYDSSKYKSSGATVTIKYNPKSPADASVKPTISSKTIGWIIIAVTVFLLIGSWVSVWLTSRYKIAAAAQGTAGAMGMIFQG